MKSHHCLLVQIISTLFLPGSNSFSVPSSSTDNINTIHKIKSIIVDHHHLDAAPNEDGSTTSPTRLDDATAIPIEKILSTPGVIPSEVKQLSLSYSSDVFPSQQQQISIPLYTASTNTKHADCLHLFDAYETKLLRCEILSEASVNVRWTAQWIPPGSTWLYNLADTAGWTVQKRCPDPIRVATFSWKAVFGMFANAFATGEIVLPISKVEGNTVLSISIVEKEKIEETTATQGEEDDDEKKKTDQCTTSTTTTTTTICSISLKESIDLVGEADRGRLQNRKVAQELASWLDVSRRPPSALEEEEEGSTLNNIGNDGANNQLLGNGSTEDNIDAEEWASMVRQRILSGVPGAGALDVDPNEEDAEGGIALLFFGILSLAVLAISLEYFTVLPELVGGTGRMPDKCDSAEVLEFGNGYLTECLGPFGDPTLYTR